MGLKVLIAEPHEVLRVGLRVIFAEDQRVSTVYEITSRSELVTHILHNELDLIVINQKLLIELALLRTMNFVIMTNEPTVACLKAAYEHGARGYLSINASAELLRTILHPTENSFLIEPTFAHSLMEHILSHIHPPLVEETSALGERKITWSLRQRSNKPDTTKSWRHR